MSVPTRPANPLAPQSFSEAERFARMLAGTELVPAAYRNKPEAILVAMQMGFEVGLNPMQAIQNIAVIGGRPAIWGDAMLALVLSHPACEYVRDGVDGDGDARHGWCEAKRRGSPAIRRTFSVADAKRAGLWNKSGPWQQYPDRMLQMRARGFALRDAFPDALRGLISQEEAQDLPAANGPVVDVMAEPQNMPPAKAVGPEADKRWPILAPDDTLHLIAPHRWYDAMLRALSRLTTAEDLRKWRDAMTPHFEVICSAGGCAEVESALEIIRERLNDLDPAEVA
jgi:hypothetical protein